MERADAVDGAGKGDVRDVADGAGVSDRVDASDGPRTRSLSERASALLAVVVTIVVLTALGLGVATLGALETETAREGLASRQAAFAAEAALRAVKSWFDAPAETAGAWMVPAAGDVDRSRRRVDPEGDGTSVAYSGAPAPWNVVYRQGRNDLFERPYRGTPVLSFEGDAKGPDLLLVDDASSPAARAYLAAFSRALFSGTLAPNLAVRITKIAVYAPPRILGGAAGPVRLGIATIDVTASTFRVSIAGDTLLATARASGVVQEVPYARTGPLGAGAIEDGSGLDVRWGTVAVAGDAVLGPDPVAATHGGWPWRSISRRLIVDANLDGTADDTDLDGAADLAEWLGLADATLDDPWLRFRVGGTIAGAPSIAAQPWPFDPSQIPGPYTTDADRSGLFQHAPGGAPTLPDLLLLRAAAADGGSEAHLFRYAGGTSPPLFAEGGEPPATFESLTRGRRGLFFFDTIDGLPPRDADADGTSDNLTPPVVVTDPAWWSGGCIVVNAAAFAIDDSFRAGAGTITPPGEPCADINGDGTCAIGEAFLRLDYPADPLAAGAAFTRLAMVTTSAAATPRARGPDTAAGISFAGLLVLAGRLEASHGARVSGAVAVAAGVRLPAAPGREPLQILYDERFGRGEWPAPDTRLPRTVWSRRSVTP